MPQRRATRQTFRTIPAKVSGLHRSYHPRWLKPSSCTGGRPRILSTQFVDGHPRVQLWSEEGVAWRPLVRVLMAQAFLSTESAVPIDGNPGNIDLANLSPTSGRGETTSMRNPRKLTAEQVVRIVEDRSAAKEVGVSASLARQIRNGSKWRTVTSNCQLPGRPDHTARDAAIAASTDPIAVIAAKHGLRETRVYQIRAKARSAS